MELRQYLAGGLVTKWAERRGFPPVLTTLIGATLLVRLVVGGLTHLTEDEAYYRLWSFSPAFGYYDHPPMIAWWIWLGRHFAGDTPLGVRLLPILATGATGLLVFDLARLAGADRTTAERAGVFFNTTLLILAGGFLAVPDAPACLFWSLTLWCALKAVRAPGIAWWACAGLAAGLACLSKYSALFLAPGLVLWLVWTGEGRRRIASPGPWIAAVIAVMVFSTNVIWNAEHGWLTFAKQFGRIAPRGFQPRYLAEFALGQTILANPLVVACALAAATRPKGENSIDLRPFLVVAGPFAAYLLFHSLHDRVQAHWPAPLYPTIALCAGAGAERLAGRWRVMSRGAAPLGVALGGAAMAVLLAPGSAFGRHDPALPMRGWPMFASRLEALRRTAGAAWVGTTSYGLASELADESDLRAPVVQLAERARWRGLGQPDSTLLHQPGLVIELPRRLSGTSLAACFSEVRPLGQIDRGDPGEPGKAYLVFLVANAKVDPLADGCPGL